jgi:hypothetical protein
MRMSGLVALGALLAAARVALAQPVPPEDGDKALAARAQAPAARTLQLHGAGKLGEAPGQADEHVKAGGPHTRSVPAGRDSCIQARVEATQAVRCGFRAATRPAGPGAAPTPLLLG